MKSFNLKKVIEVKTTSIINKIDWIKNGVPDHYLLQVFLYAYLLNIKDVILIVSFLYEENYNNPNLFMPSEENTIIYEYNMNTHYPNFQKYIEKAQCWWNNYITIGESPHYNVNNNIDEIVLKQLNCVTINIPKQIALIINNLEEKLDYLENIKHYQKEVEYLKKEVKDYIIEN